MLPIRTGGDGDRWKQVREMREKLARQKAEMDRLVPRHLREGKPPAPVPAPALGGSRPIAEPVTTHPQASPSHEEEGAELPHTRISVPQQRTLRSPLSYLHGANLTQKLLHLAGHLTLDLLPAFLTGKSKHGHHGGAPQGRETPQDGAPKT